MANSTNEWQNAAMCLPIGASHVRLVPLQASVSLQLALLPLPWCIPLSLQLAADTFVAAAPATYEQQIHDG